MKYTNKKAFAIIELLVWIFIFSLWLVSIYALIITTMKLNDYNANYIVAANLTKEQIELLKNNRDSNYKMLKPFNLKNPDWNSFNNTDKLETGHYYKIENKFWNIFPITLTDITTWFVEWKNNINLMNSYRLCLDSNNIYTYDCTWTNKTTEYYRYFYVDVLKDVNKTIDNAYIIKSKTIWYKRWYHEFEINTVLADWKRL